MLSIYMSVGFVRSDDAIRRNISLRFKERVMSLITAVDPKQATGVAGTLLAAVQGKMGMVPNMTRVMANAPAVLEGYLGFAGALGGGVLDKQLREEIALRVAQVDGCDYCLSAHSTLGKMAGLTAEQISASRGGAGATSKATAALTFAGQLLDAKGNVAEADVQTLRAAGFSDAEVLEVVAHVALNIFTNYVNNTAQVEIDFPKVSKSQL
jgi:uncharacterized peroxidase-related enzyme